MPVGCLGCPSVEAQSYFDLNNEYLYCFKSNLEFNIKISDLLSFTKFGKSTVIDRIDEIDEINEINKRRTINTNIVPQVSNSNIAITNKNDFININDELKNDQSLNITVTQRNHLLFIQFFCCLFESTNKARTNHKRSKLHFFSFFLICFPFCNNKINKIE